MQRTPKIAVFPGQFDPITNGHIDVIRRAVTLFDELIVAVGINPEKRELFPIEERVEMIQTLLKGVEGVRVECHSWLRQCPSSSSAYNRWITHHGTTRSSDCAYRSRLSTRRAPRRARRIR